MEFERLLLLWDDLDDAFGAIRHQVLNIVHGASGLTQEAATGLAGLMMIAEELPPAGALPEGTPEA